MQCHKEIVDYFNDRGVSVIFLFRRNLLRRTVSVLANSYDRYAKLLNGTHKSHVHSHEEVMLCKTAIAKYQNFLCKNSTRESKNRTSKGKNSDVYQLRQSWCHSSIPRFSDRFDNGR